MPNKSLQPTPRSRLDVYVEFAEGKRTFRNFNALYEFLESLFSMRIELITDGALGPRKARLILPTVRYPSLESQPTPRLRHGCSIQHPDFVWVVPGGRLIGIADQNGSVELVDLIHITSLKVNGTVQS